MVYVSRLKQNKQQSGLVFLKLLEDSWLIFLLAFVSAGYAALLLWCLVRAGLLLCSLHMCCSHSRLLCATAPATPLSCTLHSRMACT